jgi:hypothetical protein
MPRRILAVGLLLAAVTIGLPAGTAPPAAAQPAPPVSISGNFVGDAREEVFSYRAGEPQDEFLIMFDNGGVTGGDLTWTIFPFNVTGNSYVPVAGDFDGDGLDEIFWHGPGSIQDTMWHFQTPTSVVSIPFTVGGSYQPIVGDYTGDGVDDIHWYAPGATGDPLWEFNQGATFTSVARNVGGSYRPVVASIGKDNTDDTIWYGPGVIPDSLWDWTQGTNTQHTTQTLSISNTSYQPFQLDFFGEGPRSEDVYWYAPTATADPVWDYFFGVQFRLDNVADGFDDQGDVAVAGDYFADGGDDIIFLTNSDFSDFTLLDNPNFVFYDVTPVTSSSAGVAAESAAAVAADR